MPPLPPRPRRLPEIPLWGLPDSWEGHRLRDGAWDEEGRCVSYGLVHYRGRYWDASKPRLVVGHEMRAVHESSGDAPLEEAALRAVTTFVSDNHPPDLNDDELLAWRRSRLTQDWRLDSGWKRHEVRLDGSPTGALIKPLDNGFCVVANLAGVVLAISTRGFDTALELFQQRDVAQRYRLP